LTDEPVLDWLNNPSKKSDVSNLLKTFEKYRESHQNSNKKPEDYSAVGKSIKELKKAEKAFDIDKDGLYGSGKAKNAEKKIDKWIRENSNNPQGILKALDFRLKVDKASKKPSKTSKASSPSGNGAEKGYDASLIEKTVAALQGIDWPADKDKIVAYLEKKIKNESVKFDKAISGVWSNFKNAANNSKCTNVGLEGDSKRNYRVT
jgi:hypothetical protein|tara:strand:+ start:14 stop:628 length:615 start_codon:yes stop_codon:yes gene_type:complete